MNLEKYTQKSQEALLAAQRLAQEYQHQAIEPIHLLLALVQQEDGIVRAIVTKASGGTQAIQQELTNELDKKPRYKARTWTLAYQVKQGKFFLPLNVDDRAIFSEGAQGLRIQSVIHTRYQSTDEGGKMGFALIKRI